MRESNSVVSRNLSLSSGATTFSAYSLMLSSYFILSLPAHFGRGPFDTKNTFSVLVFTSTTTRNTKSSVTADSILSIVFLFLFSANGSLLKVYIAIPTINVINRMATYTMFLTTSEIPLS